MKRKKILSFQNIILCLNVKFSTSLYSNLSLKLFITNVVLYFKVGGMPPNRLPLVVDAENCLDRLYGGFYSGYYLLFNLL